MNVLLLGRTPCDLDDVRADIEAKEVELFAGTTLDDVRTTFGDHEIDAVIMGAGLSLQARLAIIEYIFETSDSATVHMKDRSSGQRGMIPFVNRILNGLTDRTAQRPTGGNLP